jgi:hypothetical protein
MRGVNMNLDKISDEQLDSTNIELATTEREVLAKILLHLRETERRRLYLKYHCSSLIEYAIRRMGYTEDQAWRRVNAMRLLKELPQIEQKIESGALNLTQLNQAQALFRQEKKANVVRTSNEKLELLSKLENRSRTKVEGILENESRLKPLLADVASFTSSKPVELAQFPEETQQKLKRLLEIRGHAGVTTVVKAIEQALDLALKKWDPLQKIARSTSAPARKRITLPVM